MIGKGGRKRERIVVEFIHFNSVVFSFCFFLLLSFFLSLFFLYFSTLFNHLFLFLILLSFYFSFSFSCFSLVYFDYSSVSDSVAGVTISKSNFNNNTAFGQLCNQLQAGQGGAIGLVGTTTPPVQLNEVNFTENVAFAYATGGAYSAGGAIITTFSSNLTAKNCNFKSNAAIFGGGDDITSQASDSGEQNHVYFKNCTFDSAHQAGIKTLYYLFTKVASQICTHSQSDSLGEYGGTSAWRRGRRLFSSQEEQHEEHNQTHHFSSSTSWTFNDFPIYEKENNRKYLQLFNSEILFEPVTTTKEEQDKEVEKKEEMELNAIISALKNYRPDEQANGLDRKRIESMIEELERRRTEIFFQRRKLLRKKTELEEEREEYEKENRLDRRILADEGDSSSLSVGSFSSLVSIQPDVVISGGHAVFENPVFRGEYHLFFGDFAAYRSTANTGIDVATNPAFSSKSALVGHIGTENLMITVLQSQLNVESPLSESTMIVKQLNVFNGTLTFANDIQVMNVSFLYESTVIGATSFFQKIAGSTAVIRPSNITFSNYLVTGYALSELLTKNQARLRTLILKLTTNTTGNYTDQSVLTFIGCNLVIAGDMTVDSPYRGVFETSTRFSEQLSDIPNSKILLKKNATVSVSYGGNINIVTSTVILGEHAEETIVNNFGNITLAGTTSTFVSTLGINIARLQSLAVKGSLTSVLSVLGVMNQRPSGMINIYLNHSYQTKPVLNLYTNKSLNGFVNVNFYTNGGEFCPNLNLYDTSNPSSFDIIAIENPVAGTDQLKVAAPPGLQFKKQTIPVVSASASSYSSYATEPKTMADSILTITNIGCDYLSQYYTNVESSSLSGSLYPCYVCLQNSSCELCNGGQCGVKGSCALGAEYSSSCCKHDCNPPYGTCEGSSDYSSFSCSCSNWFYDGVDCRNITVSGIVVILTACFVVLVLAIVVFLYRRSIVQKAKVLEELREGILRHTETANNEYIQNMQQALILNDVFVRYDEIKIESKIGEGSFGVVYKATFRGAQVAVKQMRSMFIELTDKDIDEFRKEAYMMSRLRHPNIVLVMGISLNEQEVLPMKSKMMARKLEDENEGQKSRQNSSSSNNNPFRSRSASSDKRKNSAKPQKTVCIITEYLEQGSLADILYGPTKLPAEIWTLELILTCALQAARGMLYLHSHQPPICHRDLKSSNLVVDDHWVVKVTDFGMSRIVPEKVQELDKGIDDERDSIGRNSIGIDPGDHSLGSGGAGGSINIPPSNNTSSGAGSRPNTTVGTSSLGLEMTSNLGTTAWCAPEILTASNRTRYSVKVDVYSFGMVLWELWEKKRPFDEYSSRFDIIDAVRAGKRPPISENCPPTFKSLIQRCWQAEPSRRPTMNYIVRYLKDELGRVKRNKASGGGGGPNNPNNPSNNNNTSRLTMSSYFRASYGSQPEGGGPSVHNSTEQPTSRPSFLGGRMSLSDRNSTNRERDHRPSDLELTEAVGGGSPLPPHNTTGVGAGVAAVQNPLLTAHQNDPNNPNNYLHNNSGSNERPSGISRESLKNLPEGRTPLVRAVDRSLSYLTESPATASPLTSNFAKYGRGQWRDKYVLKMSGWNSANPDTGLPPSSRSGGGGTGVGGNNNSSSNTPPSTSYNASVSLGSQFSAEETRGTTTSGGGGLALGRPPAIPVPTNNNHNEMTSNNNNNNSNSNNNRRTVAETYSSEEPTSPYAQSVDGGEPVFHLETSEEEDHRRHEKQEDGHKGHGLDQHQQKPQEP
jgi:serine/threonine protein kinase